MTTAVDSTFEEFFTTTHPGAVRLAYLLSRNHADAEDAVARAYVKIYRHWHRGQIERPLAYLRRAVANEVTSGFRRQRTQDRLAASQRAEERGALELEAAVVDRDALWHALSELPPRQRTVLVLRFYEQLSEREIAEVMGITAGTVKSTASRALGNLRRIMDATPGPAMSPAAVERPSRSATVVPSVPVSPDRSVCLAA
jgi:RNA polymerase sigma-70 factor (sigma-E family)